MNGNPEQASQQSQYNTPQVALQEIMMIQPTAIPFL